MKKKKLSFYDTEKCSHHPSSPPEKIVACLSPLPIIILGNCVQWKDASKKPVIHLNAEHLAADRAQQINNPTTTANYKHGKYNTKTNTSSSKLNHFDLLPNNVMTSNALVSFHSGLPNDMRDGSQRQYLQQKGHREAWLPSQIQKDPELCWIGIHNSH